MSKRDYYEILGIERNATQDQIKRAFRSKARHLHPDNQDSGDESAFKELAAAYEVLSDEQKRSLYDRYGHDGLTGASGGFDGVDFGAFSDLSEIFSQFFGGGGGGRSGFRRSSVERGADLKYDLQLDFLEAVFGTEKKVTIKHLEDCTVCSGSGASPGSGPVKCATCTGMGQIRQTTQTFLGHFTQVLTCPNCNGEGTRIEKACTNCKGRGQVRKSREIDIKIPAGIDSGARVRLPNAGDHGRRGGPPGDVYVVIAVSEDSTFIREGSTIHIKQPISYSMAALGGEVLVPTVEGPKAIKIAAGIQSGTTITMRDQGVPHLSNQTRRGDQIVHVQVETPSRLSSEEKKLFEKLAELRGESLTAAKPEKVVKPVKEEEAQAAAAGAEPKAPEPAEKTEQSSKPREHNNKSARKSKGKKKSKEKDNASIIDKLADFFGARDAADE
jgi:molecular chaperone DnaJ